MEKQVFILVEHLRGKVADISYIMLAAAREFAHEIGCDITAVVLGHETMDLTEDLAADRVLYLDAPALAEFTSDAYMQVLADLLQERQPRMMLFGDTSVGADIAGGLSERLGLPLVSACQQLVLENGVLGFISKICGGKIMAQGKVPEPFALITMIPGMYKPEDGKSSAKPEQEKVDVTTLSGQRIKLLGYIEPDLGDVDITKESVLIAVGRGIGRQDNLELVEQLAEALGGVLCASRPVVDQGWLPTSRLVGKSGKVVKPSLYIALGISGAPEHTESIVDSDLIIAVNTDPNAPIFDMAHYGAEIDIQDLLPEIIAHL